MLKSILSFIWAFAVLLAVAPGCTSNTYKPKAHQLEGDSKSDDKNNRAAMAQAPIVIIEQMKFVPDTISIKKGDTITFINKDLVAHDITGVNQHWASGQLEPGSSWRVVPQGDGDYFCSIHVVMKGRITVQ